MLTINGYTLSQFQRCKRPSVIGKTHKIMKWRPQSLLSACLRQAVYGLSSGGKLEQIASVAVNNFLAEARNPGLDVMGVDTYSLAMDYTAIIRNVLEYLSRIQLLPLRQVPPVSLSPRVSWQMLSHVDETGTLHRWDFVDYLPSDEEVLAKLHSWEIFGDMAAYETPLCLHLIAIGQRKGCHQYSPWCKIYAHPNLANIFRFQKKAGKQLEGEWKPIWFSSNSKNNPKEWVDLMLKDNAINGLIRHVDVRDVSEAHRDQFIHDVLAEADEIEKVGNLNPRDIPMSRYACDHPYACPHQLYCYTSSTLDSAGIYTAKPKKEAILI